MWWYRSLNFEPALPAAWSTGKVKGLKARGDITVDIEWVEGKLTRLQLSPVHDLPVKLLYPGGEIELEMEAEMPFIMEL